jgi:hypothetical protein
VLVLYTALMVVTAGALLSRTTAVTTLAGGAWLPFSVPHWADRRGADRARGQG